MTQENFEKAYKNGTMVCVKIFYKNGGHKYSNMFDTVWYEHGLKTGMITGYRRMNKLEKFFFRNFM